jgi:phage-related minor tail protein
MSEIQETDISIAEKSESYKAAMEEMTRRAEDFGRIFSNSLRSAIETGTDFEQTLRSIGTQMADMALERAVQPVEDFAASMFSPIMGGSATSPVAETSQPVAGYAPTINFQVNSPDIGSFSKSQSQISTMLSRTARAGSRYL